VNKLFTLGVLLKAIDELSGPVRVAARAIEGLDKVAANAKHLHELGKDLKQTGQDMAMQGVVAAGSMVAPIKAFGDLEDAETRASMAYMLGAGMDPLFKGIRNDAVELGNKLPGNTADFLEIAAALKEVGLSSDGVLHGALEATSYLKVLLGESGEDAARMMGTFRSSLGVAETDFMRLVDEVQRAKYAFGLDPNAFATTLQYVGPIGKQLGLGGIESAHQILALSGAMAQAGIKGEMLGTSLRATLSRLTQVNQEIAKSKVVAPILERAAIHLKFFEHGRFLGMEHFIGQLEQLKRLAPEQRLLVLKELFGEESASTLATILDRGVSGYHASLTAMREQASLNQRIAEVLKTQRSQLDAAGGTGVNALAEIGRTIGPDVKALAASFNDASAATASFVDEHHGLVRVLALGAIGLGVLVASVGATLVALGSLLQWTAWAVKGLSYLPAVLRSIMFVGRAVWALLVGVGEAIAALVSAVGLPVILLVAAIAAAVAAIYYYWEPIKAFFQRLWTGLQLIFQDAADWFASLNLFDAGAKIVRSIWDGMKSLAHRPIEVIRSIAAAIRDHLPFSPAKVGPLRDLQRVRIIQTIADTMRAGPMVDAMRIAASATIAAAAPAAGAQARTPAALAPRGNTVVHVSYAPQIRLPEGAAVTRDELHALLRQHQEEFTRRMRDELDDRADY
jgi:TP901 family phage tail tape measure protein